MFPGLLMLEGCSTSVWSPLVIITPRGLQEMGGTLVGHMCGSRGDSGEELNITKNCRTNLPAPRHMLMRERPVFWRNENISLIGDFDYPFSYGKKGRTF